MWLKLHMQLKNAIAGSQTEMGSPAADLQVTFLEKESLYGQIASQPTSVSLHQRWLCFWVPMGYLRCLYSHNLGSRKYSEMINERGGLTFQ